VSVRYLLDTNTCIAAMRNDALVVTRMAALTPGDCAISTITSYELYTGIAKCADPAKELA
jgi:predicted nucleic acid-binding protein